MKEFLLSMLGKQFLVLLRSCRGIIMLSILYSAHVTQWYNTDFTITDISHGLIYHIYCVLQVVLPQIQFLIHITQI